jgi:hypothetical protein
MTNTPADITDAPNAIFNHTVITACIASSESLISPALKAMRSGRMLPHRGVETGREENPMGRIGIAIMAASGLICAAAARVEAAPPTVTPSPGYDARLQEQRAASTMSAPVIVAPVRPVDRRHHAKHTRPQ